MVERIIFLVLVVTAAPALAAGGSGGAFEEPADINPANIASLQRGARNFVNYCLGCHSARYVRYSRIAKDLNIPESELAANLMFTTEKIHEPLEIAMPRDDSARWFGRTPPDLSLIARSRGVDWLYNYLRTFYVDEHSWVGVNNLMLPGASMPHVLWELQGLQRAVFEEQLDSDGNPHQVFTHFEPVTAGTLSPVEYDGFVRDLVNFLDYMGEPVKLQRQRLGVRVIAYLLVFFLLALALKKEYWKDVR